MLIGAFMSGSDLLVCMYWFLLAITIITAYMITSDGRAPR